MSVSTYLKTIWLSTLFLVGSAFASGMSESEKASSSSSSAARTPASVAGVPVAGFREIAFNRSAHGITLNCPSLQPDELTTKKMMQIVQAFKNDQLTQDLPAIKTLIKDKKTSCEILECECQNFKRSNGRRTAFEERVVGSYEGENVIIDKKKPFRYISYGSGLLFQDLVIAMKLIAAGCTDLELVLVDNYYADFFASLENDQVALSPRKGSGEAVKINNALYYFVTFFGYLKNMHKNFNLAIRVYDAPQKAIQDMPSKTCDMMYAIDLSIPQNINQEEIQRNPLLSTLQNPAFGKPCIFNGQKFTTSDYFTLADHMLKDKSFYHLSHDVRNIKLGKIIKSLTSAVHFSLSDQRRAYLYHQENKPEFTLVAANRYKFSSSTTEKSLLDSPTHFFLTDLYGRNVLTLAIPEIKKLLSEANPLVLRDLAEITVNIKLLDTRYEEDVKREIDALKK